MKKLKSLRKLLIRLWPHINLRRRKQFVLIVILTVFVSIFEIISIGAVLPFIAVLTAPERIFENNLAQPLIKLLDLTAPKQLLLPITVGFGGAAIISGAARLLLFWASTRLSFATGADLSTSIFQRTLFQPYSVHCARNTSEVITGVSTKANSVIYGVIFPLLMVSSSVIILCTILVALLVIDPAIALTSFGGFGVIYLVVIGLTRRQLINDSKSIAKESTEVIKVLQESLGGIRDVLINGNQSTYCKIFQDADLSLRQSQGNHMFIGQSPRYVVEALGMLLIAALAYLLSQQTDGIARAIPVLGALAMGAQRLLPVLQSIYGSYTSIRGHQAILNDVVELLDQPMPKQEEVQNLKTLPFTKRIYINQMGFQYSAQAPFVLKNVNIEILKGSRVGFIGTTGSGKSTLLDILMALLEPTAGELYVDEMKINEDNRSLWWNHIAHVPQTIFLIDGTISENIAFGVPKEKIDYSRVRQAAKQAQIADTIESWPMQYQTRVGERGIRLSGGQRQRIAIARALYRKADVIVFDEATSALDDETEKLVMESVYSLSEEITILIIAHRLTTLRNCTHIVELDGGGIKSITKKPPLPIVK